MAGRGIVLWFTLALFWNQALAQKFLGDIIIDVQKIPGPSDACRAAMMRGVNCDGSLAMASFEDKHFSLDSLRNAICSKKCTESLHEYRRHVSEKCGNNTLVLDGVTYTSTFIADKLLFRLESVCRAENKNNDKCGHNTNFLDLLFDSQLFGCANLCGLEQLQFELGSPFGYSEELARQFASMTSKCSVTGYSYTTPTPAALNGSATAPVKVPITSLSLQQTSSTPQSQPTQSRTTSRPETPSPTPFTGGAMRPAAMAPIVSLPVVFLLGVFLL
ncbi:hypothetical protein LOZ66_003816 [Ophidiomyces ophidiicola]|nr:hypothetical protein LOZ66_003816 [Ophidiomyces ophidiicola]